MILPYLELPVCVGYANGEEGKVVVGKFQPVAITAYHEGYMPDVGMFIYIGEQPFQIALSLDQYEEQIRGYWNIVNRKQDVKSKLGIVS
jgi:hypothetical protein